jgi:hypothetical protein
MRFPSVPLGVVGWPNRFALQKVVGSSPIIRSRESLARRRPYFEHSADGVTPLSVAATTHPE